MISRVQAATTGRVLMLYFVLRQATAALGLTSLGGHAQMVRPLIAPMAEAAAVNRHGELPESVRQQIRAHIGRRQRRRVLWRGHLHRDPVDPADQGLFEQNGISIEPLHLSVWAIPTAIAALLIHCTRLALLDRRLTRGFGLGQEGAR